MVALECLFEDCLTISYYVTLLTEGVALLILLSFTLWQTDISVQAKTSSGVVGEHQFLTRESTYPYITFKLMPVSHHKISFRTVCQ